MTKTVYQILHGSEEGPVDDWRDFLARMADAIVSEHYRDYARLWPRPLTRRVLEAILDTPECLVSWSDVQGLAQAATEEAMTLGAIVGASLAVTWPQRPQDLDGWLDRAREVTGLAIDEAGIKPGYLATEISKRGGWGTTQ